MDVTLPDGTIIQNVPEGTTKAELTAKLQNLGRLPAQAPVTPKPEERSSLRGLFQGAVLDPIVGSAQLISHAADTGNLTAPSPIAMGGNLLIKAFTGQKPSTQPSQVTQAIDKFANQYKAPEGVDVARLVGNVVSPINYALPEARLSGLIPNIAKGAAIGAGYGAIQPVENALDYSEAKTSQIGFGAAGGALIPPVLRGVSGIASGIKSKFIDPIANQNKIISSLLMSSVGKENAPKVINAIENIKAQTPDVNLTTGQASGNAALNAIEDALSAKNPSGAISQLNQKNRTVLADVLRNMSGDEESINMAKLARSQIAAPLYKAEEQNLYTGGKEFENLLSRAKASGALTEAQKIAEIRGTKFTLPMIDYPQYESRMVDLPMGEKVPFDFAEKATQAVTGTDKGVLASLRSAGGLNMSELRDLVGEKATNKAKVQVGTFTKAGMGLDDAVMHSVDKGYLPESVLSEVDGGAQKLRDLIQSELSGNKAQKFGIQDELRAAWEKSMGEAPQVELHPYEGIAKSAAPLTPEEPIIGKGIKGMDLMNLKKGIDQAISDATGPKKIELQSLKKDYESWLASKSPGFAQATEAFAEASKPINKMQMAKALTQKFVPSTTAVGETPSRLNAASLAKALQEKDALARSVTKFEGAKFKTIFSPEDVKAIESVSADASKIAEAAAMGTGFGSATARRQSIGQFINSDLENKSPVLSTMLKVFNIIPGAQYITKGVSGAANMIGDKLNNQMTLELERMMAEDPQAVANALKLELSGVPPTIKGQILKEIMDNLPKEFTTILAAKTAIQSNE